jgi:predicted nuclease with TOPRIM domain
MNIEDRVTSLEGTIGILNKIALQQMTQNREMAENVTMLAGVVASQERDIKEMKADLSNVKESLAHVEIHLAHVDSHLERLEDRFTRLETRMDERFDAIMALLQARQ